MKKRAIIALTALTTLSLVACASETGSSSATSSSSAGVSGTYTGEAAGINGDPVTTTVTLENSVIINVEVVGEGETEGIGTNAIEQLPSAIVEANSLNVDVVSGATVTSNAILSGAKAALESAGLNPQDYGYATQESEETVVEYRDIDIDALANEGMSITYASQYGVYEQEGDSIDSCIKATVYVNDEDQSVVYITLDEALLPLADGGADGFCVLDEEDLENLGENVVSRGDVAVPATIQIGDIVWNATIEGENICYVATIDGEDTDFISYVATNEGGKWYYEVIDDSPALVLDNEGNTLLEITVGTKASANHGVDFWPSSITFPGNIELIKNYVYDNGVTYESYPESDDIQQNEDGVWTVQDVVTGATLAGTPNYLNFIKRAYDAIQNGEGETYQAK